MLNCLNINFGMLLGIQQGRGMEWWCHKQPVVKYTVSSCLFFLGILKHHLENRFFTLGLAHMCFMACKFASYTPLSLRKVNNCLQSICKSQKASSLYWIPPPSHSVYNSPRMSPRPLIWRRTGGGWCPNVHFTTCIINMESKFALSFCTKETVQFPTQFFI